MILSVITGWPVIDPTGVDDLEFPQFVTALVKAQLDELDRNGGEDDHHFERSSPYQRAQ